MPMGAQKCGYLVYISLVREIYTTGRLRDIIHRKRPLPRGWSPLHERLLVQAKSDQDKLEGVAEDEDIQSCLNIISSSSPNLWTCDSTGLWVVETFHCFEVPNNGKAKKPKIFDALGDIESSTKGSRTIVQARAIEPYAKFSNPRLGQCAWEQSVRRLKNYRKVPLLEPMLSLEQKRALATKDRILISGCHNLRCTGKCSPRAWKRWWRRFRQRRELVRHAKKRTSWNWEGRTSHPRWAIRS